MTTKKQLKGRVRARMAKTGESYTAALRHVDGLKTATMDLGYTLRGGQHPETANIANVLAHHKIRANGRPISEALVLGIGGGLGAGYILWEFKLRDLPSVVLAFRNQWQYPDAWTQKTLGRLGVSFRANHMAGAAGAARVLSHHLTSGQPCIIRPDRFPVGYWRLPRALDGFGGHDIVVYAEQDGLVHVDDRNVSPLLVQRQRVDEARARVGSYKNSLYVIDAGSMEISSAVLKHAVIEGLQDQVEHLSARSDSFSLPAWRKWSRLITDTRNAKAWSKVFAGGRGVASALISIWEGTSPMGMTGGHLRDLYANFLDEAADILAADQLREAAAGFRRAAEGWQTVASTALPEDVADFARARKLTIVVRESVADPASTSVAEAERASQELWELRSRLDRELPLDASQISDVFQQLSAATAEVFDRESVALAQLKTAVSRLPEASTVSP